MQLVQDNKMTVNPGKFQAITRQKEDNHAQEIIKIDKNTVKVKSSVLGIQIDAELNFSLHIANISRSTSNQPNALIRLRKFLGFQEKKITSLEVPKGTRGFTEKGTSFSL